MSKAIDFQEPESVIQAVVRAIISDCLEIMALPTGGPENLKLFENVEQRLADLSAAQLDSLLAEPSFSQIQSELIQARAKSWFIDECEIARKFLGSSVDRPLAEMFGDHIIEDAYADELNIIRAYEPSSIMVIGSGPCPMTAYVFRQAFPEVRIECVDKSAISCELSTELMRRSHVQNVAVRCVDACDLQSLDNVDCIVMALTVGLSTDEKDEIADIIRGMAAPGTVLAVRSAAGWGKAFYPVFAPQSQASKDAENIALSTGQRSVLIPIIL